MKRTGNRYTGAELTKRQAQTIDGCMFKIERIMKDLADKNLTPGGSRTHGRLYHAWEQLRIAKKESDR